ncbi:MAG: hypothetical protein KDC44_07810, partial [Phaeodactylibacter sp.]|nr:hypothetical protein [Phaeodactylibacter sp.]
RRDFRANPYVHHFQMSTTMPSIKIASLLIGLILLSCKDEKPTISELDSITFHDPQAVVVEGYEGHLMEPFLTRDGSILFFNNLNDSTANTNLHWCTKINDTLFEYQGELAGVNTESLEGVPTMDAQGHFFYVYTGDYEQTLSTIYVGQYAAGSIADSELVEHISREMGGWVNFDVEVSNDGNTLYFVDGRFDASGGPYESNLVIAEKDGDQFARADNSEELLKNINTADLEYAAAISKDELEICFTRVAAPLTASSAPKIFIANRSSKTEPFSEARQISNLTGFIEAPTYTSDVQAIYFHKKVDGIHKLYIARKQ